MASRRSSSGVRPARGAAALQLAKTARRLRAEGGWTLEDVAERAGLDPRHIQLVESGSANPTLSTLVRVAKGLGTTLGELVTDRTRESERGTAPPTPHRAKERGGLPTCAQRVKLERLSRGWSQGELASRVGMSVGAVQGLELGKKSPTVRTLDGIAEALGVQTWTLLVPHGPLLAASRTRVSRRVAKSRGLSRRPTSVSGLAVTLSAAAVRGGGRHGAAALAGVSDCGGSSPRLGFHPVPRGR